MQTSEVLGLPFISSAQAQKHITHNEAIQKLDVLIQASVLTHTTAVPPASPADGERHIVPADATQGWQDKDNAIAIFRNGAWAFEHPQIGWRVYSQEAAALLLWSGNNWEEHSGDSAIDRSDEFGINTQPDPLNRLSVKSDATLFSHDDVTPGSGSHRMKLNKAGTPDTATLLYQKAYSGRAEMGLAGNDDFSVKVSDDGTNWTEAIRIDAASGGVSMPFFDSTQLIIGPDAVGTVIPPSKGGILFLSIVNVAYPQNSTASIFAYDVGSSPLLTSMVIGSAVRNLGTQTLTGTTGTSGKVSVAVDNTGKLYIENRFIGGVAHQFCLTFINSYRALS